MLVSAQYNHTTARLSTVWDRPVFYDDTSQVTFTDAGGAQHKPTIPFSGDGTNIIVWTTAPTGLGPLPPLLLQAPWAFPGNYWVTDSDPLSPGNDPITDFVITQV